MCGRFALPGDAADSKILKIDLWNWQWTEPHFSVAPTTSVPIVVKNDVPQLSPLQSSQLATQTTDATL